MSCQTLTIGFNGAAGFTFSNQIVIVNDCCIFEIDVVIVTFTTKTISIYYNKCILHMALHKLQWRFGLLEVIMPRPVNFLIA